MKKFKKSIKIKLTQEETNELNAIRSDLGPDDYFATLLMQTKEEVLAYLALNNKTK